ncbi:protein MAIN-LIKE 1-like isoform X1 [Arachis hypogaea]|uniref:protein MAIN-LIKE 1-like isoform X1 n=2 Tax=Arachis hypogaea TaxID=3818 RepID=UPI003B211AFC
MLMCEHYKPPDRYNEIVESQLRETDFYYVSQIGVVQCQSAMVNALVERWRPETHTFHFPVGECAVTLEDVVMILSLPTNGLPVTGPTMSSFEALEAECLHQFGVAPRKTDCRGSFIKLTWFRGLKDRIVLNDDVHIQMYVKDEDEDEDEDADEDDAVDEDPAPSAATSEKSKGYNLRADPPRRSANRYTPSAFNKIAKKCKKLYKDMKWGPRK